MFKYLITFGDGSQWAFFADSPKAAWQRAEKINIVAHVRWIK